MASWVVLPASSIGEQTIMEGDEHLPEGREVFLGGDRSVPWDDRVSGPASLRMRSAAAIMPPIHPRLEASMFG